MQQNNRIDLIKIYFFSPLIREAKPTEVEIITKLKKCATMYFEHQLCFYISSSTVVRNKMLLK